MSLMWWGCGEKQETADVPAWDLRLRGSQGSLLPGPRGGDHRAWPSLLARGHLFSQQAGWFLRPVALDGSSARLGCFPQLQLWVLGGSPALVKPGPKGAKNGGQLAVAECRGQRGQDQLCLLFMPRAFVDGMAPGLQSFRGQAVAGQRNSRSLCSQSLLSVESLTWPLCSLS